MGILAITYGVWKVSSKYEVRVQASSFYPLLPTTTVAIFFIASRVYLSLTSYSFWMATDGAAR